MEGIKALRWRAAVLRWENRAVDTGGVRLFVQFLRVSRWRRDPLVAVRLQLFLDEVTHLPRRARAARVRTTQAAATAAACGQKHEQGDVRATDLGTECFV